MKKIKRPYILISFSILMLLSSCAVFRNKKSAIIFKSETEKLLEQIFEEKSENYKIRYSAKISLDKEKYSGHGELSLMLNEISGNVKQPIIGKILDFEINATEFISDSKFDDFNLKTDLSSILGEEFEFISVKELIKLFKNSLPYESKLVEFGYNTELEGDTIFIRPRDLNEISLPYNMSIDKNLGTIKKLEYRSGESILEIAYKDFKIMSERNFPSKIEINLNGKKSRINVLLKYLKVEIIE